jgi:hypothetical protein
VGVLAAAERECVCSQQQSASGRACSSRARVGVLAAAEREWACSQQQSASAPRQRKIKAIFAAIMIFQARPTIIKEFFAAIPRKPLHLSNFLVDNGIFCRYSMNSKYVFSYNGVFCR